MVQKLYFLFLSSFEWVCNLFVNVCNVCGLHICQFNACERGKSALRFFLKHNNTTHLNVLQGSLFEAKKKTAQFFPSQNGTSLKCSIFVSNLHIFIRIMLHYKLDILFAVLCWWWMKVKKKYDLMRSYKNQYPIGVIHWAYDLMVCCARIVVIVTWFVCYFFFYIFVIVGVIMLLVFSYVCTFRSTHLCFQ